LSTSFAKCNSFSRRLPVFGFSAVCGRGGGGPSFFLLGMVDQLGRSDCRSLTVLTQVCVYASSRSNLQAVAGWSQQRNTYRTCTRVGVCSFAARGSRPLKWTHRESPQGPEGKQRVPTTSRSARCSSDQGKQGETVVLLKGVHPYQGDGEVANDLNGEQLLPELAGLRHLPGSNQYRSTLLTSSGVSVCRVGVARAIACRLSVDMVGVGRAGVGRIKVTLRTWYQ
jgi:hypothetical protein